MSTLRSTSVVLDSEFLPIRAKLLEIAAALDRVDRAEGKLAADDAREGQIRTAIESLLSASPDRAEQIQLIFSLAYDASWIEKQQLTGGR